VSAGSGNIPFSSVSCFKEENTSKMKKLFFCFPTLALAAAFAASSYNVTLFEQSTAAGKTFKAGDYKLELKDDAVVLKHNKEVTEIPARFEAATNKFNSTSIRYNDKHEMQEIHLGGTNKKVILGSAQNHPSNAGL
jgi:basic membrane lipoprotein Med (substrate-binding protein (PBP1-ABC) superfamily)